MGEDPSRLAEEDERQRRLDEERLDEELVPLSLAAHVAYLHLADTKVLVADAQQLSRALTLAALALSRVAPIRAKANGAPRPLGARELHERLFIPAQRHEALHLDDFLIRRGELRAAISTLMQSRALLP